MYIIRFVNWEDKKRLREFEVIFRSKRRIYPASAGDGFPALMRQAGRGGRTVRRIRNYTEFGLWARGILTELNMTQSELAEAVGVGKSTITDIFTGRTKNNKLLRDCITGYLEGKIAADG